MGSQQSSQDKKAKIKHEKFQNIQYLNNYQTVRTKLQVQNQDSFNQWKKNLMSIENIEDESLLLPRAYEMTRKTICGSSGVVDIDYDNFPFILRDEIRNRNTQDAYFSQNQIWYLLYNLVMSATIFKKFNKKVGDVRPANIFLNETGQVKVSNLYSWPGQITNYEKTIFNHEQTYLAPEQVVTAKEGKVKIGIDPHLAQSFSIGLTLLQTTTLFDVGTFYKNKNFDREGLEQLLNELWKINISEDKNQYSTYSNTLKMTVASLCEIQYTNRASAEQIYYWLEPYDSDISNLQPFNPTPPPVRKNFYTKYETQKHKMKSDLSPMFHGYQPSVYSSKYEQLPAQDTRNKLSNKIHEISHSKNPNISQNQSNYINPSPSPMLSSNQSPLRTPSQSPTFTISQNQSFSGSPQMNKANPPQNNLKIQYQGVQRTSHQPEGNYNRNSIQNFERHSHKNNQITYQPKAPVIHQPSNQVQFQKPHYPQQNNFHEPFNQIKIKNEPKNQMGHSFSFSLEPVRAEIKHPQKKVSQDQTFSNPNTQQDFLKKIDYQLQMSKNLNP